MFVVSLDHREMALLFLCLKTIKARWTIFLTLYELDIKKLGLGRLITFIARY